MPYAEDDGFSILEALFAAALFAAAVVTLLTLVMGSAEQSTRMEIATVASTLAQAKLEELRGVNSDELSTSPADAHMKDTAPFIDLLDRFGEPLVGDGAPTYVRRWSIAEVTSVPGAFMLAACVTTAGHRSSMMPASCVWAIRVRRP